VNDGKLKDPRYVVSAFNNLFITAEKLNTQQTEDGDAISNLKDSFLGNFSSIKIIPITEAKINSTIHSLKPEKNSSHYDKITNKI
jgi:hypothetical protein